MAGTPSRVPKVALPSRFPVRVYVGDSLQVIAQKGDREGGPPGFHEGVTPTPCLSNGRGVPVRLSWRVGVPPLSRHRSLAGTPSRVPKVAPPSRFPARVYVGDSLHVIAQKWDREGGAL